MPKAASGRSVGVAEVDAPTLADPVAAALSDRLGGPVGEHSRPHWWWTPVRVLLAVFTLVFALGMLVRTPCVADHWGSNDVQYAKMCYSDVPYLYRSRGFAEQVWPYRDGSRYTAMEYPVLISYMAWVASELTTIDLSGPPESVRAASPIGDLYALPGMNVETNLYFFITALLLFGCGLLATYFLAGAHRRRPWDALPFALSPALLASELINWDLLAVMLTAGALWAWGRGRPVWAGILIGLGTAAKLYPLFLLGALLVVAVRSRRLTRFWVSALAAAVAWLLVNAPAYLGSPARWSYFWHFNADRGADLGSLWLILSQRGAVVTPHLINVWSWLLFAAACVGVLVLGLRAPRTPRVAQLGFLIVAAFLIVNKVYSPQYVLWLLPLAVMARPRWRDLLIWQAAELCYYGAVWTYLGGWLQTGSGGQEAFYHLAILVRVAGELYLMAVVVRDLLRPEHDPVRQITTRSNAVAV